MMKLTQTIDPQPITLSNEYYMQNEIQDYKPGSIYAGLNTSKMSASINEDSQLMRNERNVLLNKMSGANIGLLNQQSGRTNGSPIEPKRSRNVSPGSVGHVALNQNVRDHSAHLRQ